MLAKFQRSLAKVFKLLPNYRTIQIVFKLGEVTVLFLKDL